MELIFQPLLLCKWGPTSSWVCFDLPEIRFTKVSLNFFAALCSRLIMNSLRWNSNKQTHYTSANNRCTRVELNHVSFEFPNDQKDIERRKVFKNSLISSLIYSWAFFIASFINTRIYSNYLQNYYLNASKAEMNHPELSLV